ncbi:siphovirus Gp157 family protein [Variovorax sp. GT1P44]|uniref:siphovirus Gp157 family protein n=1 Tax=Variovorax sp. GT1P44 TaxID=3443742 RepID=UPI003F449656
MNTPTLYEISAAYRADVEKLANLDLDEETLADTLEGMSGELEEKAQNVIFFARNLEATAAAIKEAEAKMAARRKALETRADGLRRYVFSAMQLAGVTKIECPYFRLAIQNNPPSVDLYEPDLLPLEYMTQPETPPPAPDRKAIGAALKAGKDVPGAKLTQGQRLAIS